MRSLPLALAFVGALVLAAPAHAQLIRDPGVPEPALDPPSLAFDDPSGDVLLPDEVAPAEALLRTPGHTRGDVPYVIVTNRRLAPVFWPFALWKSFTGTRATVRTVEWIHERYPGRDRAERVRAFLQDAHANWNSRWLLVGGDSTAVPMRLASIVPLDPSLPDVVPTDWYFACLDGNWDANGNGRFGELSNPSAGFAGDSADVVPELHVGRAPVTTRAEARDFLRRTRAAYATADPDFARSALLAAGALNPGFPYGTLLDLLATPLADAGRTAHRLYEFPSSLPLVPGADSCGRASLLAALASGPSLAVLAFNTGLDGIATRSGPVNVSAEDLHGLANGARRGHVVALGSSTCSPGAQSVARAMLSAPAGGIVSCYGPTAISFLSPSSQALRDYALRVATGERSTLGEASSARPAMLFQFRGGEGYVFALFGDPQLRVPAPPPAIARPLRTPRQSTAGPAAGELAFAAPLASPVRGSLRVQWSAPAAGAVDVDVFDVTGRRVAALVRGAVAPVREATWDLRDEGGSRVAPGVYLVRAAGAGRAVAERVVVLP